MGSEMCIRDSPWPAQRSCTAACGSGDTGTDWFNIYILERKSKDTISTFQEEKKNRNKNKNKTRERIQGIYPLDNPRLHSTQIYHLFQPNTHQNGSAPWMSTHIALSGLMRILSGVRANRTFICLHSSFYFILILGSVSHYKTFYFYLLFLNPGPNAVSAYNKHLNTMH